MIQAFIVYLSPSGTTRHVAGVIESSLGSLGVPAAVVDLGKGGCPSTLLAEIAQAGAHACLFIGSPVYACHAVPPVMSCIESLPDASGGCAVPFVTWGGVTSGIALEEMGSALCNRGFDVVAAAKILAVHSLMWQCDHPLGEGHPDADDDALAAGLVRATVEAAGSSGVRPDCLPKLSYQPKEARTTMQGLSLDAARGMLPERRVDPKRCTQCGICKEVCPVNAVTCSPYPSFGGACILCYNCMRLCPEDAIAADFSSIEGWLRDRAKKAEQPLSEVFT